MDQLILALIFVLSLGAGLVALLQPILAILLAILKYLKFLFSGPFKTTPVEKKTKQK